jgi:glycosyltransferase involved in cell wall biosynthesis
VEQFDAGTLVDPGDVNSLAGAMVWWADHAEARRETGERNRRTIEDRFSWEASARALLAFYESLLDPAVRRDVGYPCSAAGSEAES